MMAVFLFFIFSLYSVLIVLLFDKIGHISLAFIPPTLSSLIICVTLLHKQFKKNASIFHPLPLVCIVLIWSMVLAPIVALTSGYHLAIPPKEINWPIWFLVITYIYFICLLFLYLGISSVEKVKLDISTLSHSRQKTLYWGFFFLLITFICQLYVYYKFNGIYGYVLTWTLEREKFSGLGPVLTVAEAFPIIGIFVVLLLRDKIGRETFIFVLAAFLVFFIAKLLFGGLRGSRSNTIWGLFWFAGVIHLSYYRFKTMQFVLGFIFLLSFMSIYSIYKTYGVDSFNNDVSVTSTGRYEGNPLIGILLTDFSRAGEHAFLLSEVIERDDYESKLGATYFTAIAKLLPGIDSPFGKESKNSAGAELFYGTTVLDAGDTDSFYNSRIYGLYGEGLLNFGPLVPVILFLILGIFLSLLNKFCISLKPQDIRVLLVPFLSNLCLLLILADLDNIIFFFIKNGFIPFVFVFIVSNYIVWKRYGIRKDKNC
ncbi:hypothetical protein L1D29_19600 [Shewanella insulae]|uniref:hypothetical protein n=1 Tax=Shewanella insulae TaxID=2681496 RepID=UPI001EFCBAD5|nr:hypothetical protein [Shewanella insulae]MCG9714997.1 hypothetical protein [Shewanella insulae]